MPLRYVMQGIARPSCLGMPPMNQHTITSIVPTFIACRLDWCESLLYGVPEYLLRKVQSVQNTAARLPTSTRRRDHIIPVLHQLHWLPVQRRVEFKIVCLVYQSLASTAPTVSCLVMDWITSQCSRLSSDIRVGNTRFRDQQMMLSIADPTR